MTGTGPVEPVNPPDADESYEVIGVDTPRLADRLAARWAGLSTRTRAAVLATGLAGLAAAGALLLSPDDPEPRDPLDLSAWPVNVTRWDYLGTGSTANSPATSGRYRFAVSVLRGPDVTLRVTGAAFDGIRAQTVPRPEFTVPGGTTRRITVEISVSDCSELPLDAGFHYLDVTLRNTHAIQRHSFIFGGAFSRDVSELLHAACDAVPARPGPRPTGSASSQNAD
ncbi:hypothetical protein OHT76_11250 [Streptomyces sp. NBC_00287]|uniref:hypothetical protein n=1 Tax=Streptomyces sp. NBC_00287 TaxID=2975702 RepID=UPI002E28083D|nr:hypothetical protein [Streptomyces sp. NBC_00287]